MKKISLFVPFILAVGCGGGYHNDPLPSKDHPSVLSCGTDWKVEPANMDVVQTPDGACLTMAYHFDKPERYAVGCLEARYKVTPGSQVSLDVAFKGFGTWRREVSIIDDSGSKVSSVKASNRDELQSVNAYSSAGSGVYRIEIEPYNADVSNVWLTVDGLPMRSM